MRGESPSSPETGPGIGTKDLIALAHKLGPHSIWILDLEARRDKCASWMCQTCVPILISGTYQKTNPRV